MRDRAEIVGSLPRFNVGSASTSPFSGPAQRSLHVAARMLAESPTRPSTLQPFRHLHDCSDCYRLERKLLGNRAFTRRTLNGGKLHPAVGKII
jgi:hypothetical protein